MGNRVVSDAFLTNVVKLCEMLEEKEICDNECDIGAAVENIMQFLAEKVERMDQRDEYISRRRK